MKLQTNKQKTLQKNKIKLTFLRSVGATFFIVTGQNQVRRLQSGEISSFYATLI